MTYYTPTIKTLARDYDVEFFKRIMRPALDKAEEIQNAMDKAKFGTTEYKDLRDSHYATLYAAAVSFRSIIELSDNEAKQ